ncbi:hypothetical protein SAMN05216285_2129 [Natrinema salifodinae]|uniref:Uncharacterized protein n=1 Tax=Natrinema salifodinae TaxID=1202768 RepID=A0A1I0P507_9EURY|nr:hypothetical protein SAMN05216285_2129 [Natrinema salifodinae]
MLLHHRVVSVDDLFFIVVPLKPVPSTDDPLDIAANVFVWTVGWRPKARGLHADAAGVSDDPSAPDTSRAQHVLEFDDPDAHRRRKVVHVEKDRVDELGDPVRIRFCADPDVDSVGLLGTSQVVDLEGGELS